MFGVLISCVCSYSCVCVNDVGMWLVCGVCGGIGSM